VAINWIESTPATDDLTGDYHAVAGVRGLVATITFLALALSTSECQHCV
jgi:hypothetical protein